MGEIICGDPFDWAAWDPGRPMFAVRAGGRWQPVTAAQFAGRVSSVAAGLVAAGIAPGDRVGLMAGASLDWLACDFAIWAAGAITVPVYETSSADQVRWVLGDAGAVAAFAGNERLAGTIGNARLPKLETLWRMDGGGLDALARAGREATAAETAAGQAAAEVSRRRGALTPQTLATIVYTSGSTGQPKGCMISHGNLAAAVNAITAIPGLRERVLTDDASMLSFLPLSHILARVVALCLVHAGLRAGYLSSPGQLARELPAFRPTVLLAVPRVLGKVIAAARAHAEAGGHQRLFAAAEATAVAYGRAGRWRRGPWLRVRHAVFARLVYRRLRATLGGRAAWIISGGAPLGTGTGPGAILGTLQYMSPEQLDGQELTPASDVFALGTVLARTATGHDPFRAQAIPALITRIASGQPDLDPLTGDLRDIISSCLAKSPADRPALPGLISRLQPPGRAGPQPAHQAPPVPGAAAVPAEVPGVAPGLAVPPPAPGMVPGSMVPTAAAGVLPGTGRPSADPVVVPGPVVPSAVPVRASVPVALPASPAPSAPPVPAPSAAPPASTIDVGATAPPRQAASPRPDHHGDRYKPGRAAILATAALTVAAAIAVPSVLLLDQSPAGSGAARGRHQVSTPATAATRQAAPTRPTAATRVATATLVTNMEDPAGGYDIHDALFAPDGHTLITDGGNNGGMDVWDTASGRLATSLAQPGITNPSEQFVTSVAFAPGSTIAAAGNADGSTTVWDTGTGRRIATLTDPSPHDTLSSQGVGYVALAPGGAILAAADADGITYLWNITTRKVTTAITAPSTGGGSGPLAFMPGGKDLAIEDSSSGIDVWSIAPRKIIASFHSPGGASVRDFRITAGGTLVITDEVDHVYLWNVTSGKTVTLTQPRHVYYASLAIGAGGLILATTDAVHRIYLWNTATGKVIGAITDPRGQPDQEVNALALAPDGRTLAAGDGFGSVTLWHLTYK